MAKNANNKNTRSVLNVAEAIDPFAERVEVTAAKKPAVKAAKVSTSKTKRTVKAASRNNSKDLANESIDVFAVPVVDDITSSPTKKKTTSSVAAKSKSSIIAKPVKAEKAKTVVAKKAAKVSKGKAVKATKPSIDINNELAVAEPQVEMSPAFKALSDVSLPELDSENRARLLMQSPTKLYFYWSVKNNPWQQLKNIFGNDLGSYTLVVKLTDLKRDTEEIHPCEAEGNWWFNVEADGDFQAEVGFYAVNRPYFRVIYSNSIQTPRRSPSVKPASESQWTVSANKFAEVLDVAGFSRDAFDVAMAGDDQLAAEHAAHTAFAGLIGTRDGIDQISAEDIRYALLALASGFTLEELRSRVSPALFGILQAHTEKLAADAALDSLMQHFDIDEAEWTEEEFSAAVYGASLVHFPKTLKTKKIASKGRSPFSPRYNPVSSHSIGR